MALGDGIRRNIAHVDQGERDMLLKAILEMHQRFYPGNRSDTPPGGVSWWFKQDEIHQATHVHGGPEFVPWHRDLINRFEALLRTIEPRLSLHYWDWTTDPQPLFMNTFMGSANGLALDPWAPFAGNPPRPGFYDPNANPYRGDSAFDTQHNNPFDPPRNLTRAKQGGVPNLGVSDAQILAAATYPQMRLLLEGAHDSAHGYIGGNLGDQHVSFRDPFVFLLHSNVERIYAQWQTDPAHPKRLDPNTVYGTESDLDVQVFEAGETHIQNLTHMVEPWSTGVGEFHSIRPWEATHENQGFPHDYHHISVVAPPRYDTNAAGRPPAVTTSGENRLDVFDGAIYHKFFDGDWGPGNINAAWEYIGGVSGGHFIGSPAAVSWESGRLDIFALGSDGQMYHKFYDAGWGPGNINAAWESIGVLPGGQLPDGRQARHILGSPAAVSWEPGRFDIFALGSDGQMYHKFYDAGWGPGNINAAWESIGGVTGGRFIGSPAVVSWKPRRLDIFALGSDGQMYHKFYDAGWGPGNINAAWESIGAIPGGQFRGSPAAVSWKSGRFDIFALGSDGQMYHKFYDAGWGPGNINAAWESIGAIPGGQFRGSPAAVSWGPRRLDIFALGSDGQMYHKFYDADWGPGNINAAWESIGGVLGGRFTDSPAAVSWGPRRLDVFARGSDGQMYHKFYDADWGPNGINGSWESIGT